MESHLFFIYCSHFRHFCLANIYISSSFHSTFITIFYGIIRPNGNGQMMTRTTTAMWKEPARKETGHFFIVIVSSLRYRSGRERERIVEMSWVVKYVLVFIVSHVWMPCHHRKQIYKLFNGTRPKQEASETMDQCRPSMKWCLFSPLRHGKVDDGQFCLFSCTFQSIISSSSIIYHFHKMCYFLIRFLLSVSVRISA